MGSLDFFEIGTGSEVFDCALPSALGGAIFCGGCAGVFCMGGPGCAGVFDRRELDGRVVCFRASAGGRGASGTVFTGVNTLAIRSFASSTGLPGGGTFGATGAVSFFIEPGSLGTAVLGGAAGVGIFCGAPGPVGVLDFGTCCTGFWSMGTAGGADGLVAMAGADGLVDTAGADGLVGTAGADGLVVTAGADGLVDSTGAGALVFTAGADGLVVTAGADDLVVTAGAEVFAVTAGAGGLGNGAGAAAGTLTGTAGAGAWGF